MGSAIETRDLVKTYGKDVRALDGLSFTVDTGAIFGLLGPNGAGKSTTVKILTTLTRPDAGEAYVVGHDVRRQAADIRRLIGVVGQKSSSDPVATGRENLTLQGRVYGLRGRKARARADELLERFGLADAADRVVRTYSGGMQRRLDVAMGLIHRPRVLFLDEPTTGLDPEARADMWREVNGLRAEEDITILLTTHYMEEADQLADQILIVDRGRAVAAGSPDDLKSQLRGDAIHIELAESVYDGAVERALANLDGFAMREITVRDRQLRARVDSGATAVPAVLQALDGQGLKVTAVTVSRPSLDDVYLRHTGRAFSEADQEGVTAR